MPAVRRCANARTWCVECDELTNAPAPLILDIMRDASATYSVLGVCYRPVFHVPLGQERVWSWVDAVDARVDRQQRVRDKAKTHWLVLIQLQIHAMVSG